MNSEKHLRKSEKNKKKKQKIKIKMPHVNKKPLPKNRIFVQTPFSHSTFKLERKKFTPQNHSLFRSISCFGVTKITTPIWLQKSWKCVNRSLKKKTAPQYNSNSLNCKKTKRRPIIAPATAVRLLINRLTSNELLSNCRRGQFNLEGCSWKRFMGAKKPPTS